MAKNWQKIDSRTSDASRNYQLKSAESELFKHSFFHQHSQDLE